MRARIHIISDTPACIMRDMLGDAVILMRRRSTERGKEREFEEISDRTKKDF